MTKFHRHLHQKKQRTLIAKKQRKAKLVDRLTYTAAVVEPILTIPQVVVIFRQQSADSISLATWIGYEMLTLIWIWYAIVHKERLIFVYQGLFFIVQLAIIVGGLLYGAPWW